MILPALALSLALGGAPQAPQALAHVDGVQITRADLDERLRVMRQFRNATAPASAVVANLVDEALLAAEGRRLGLDKTPGFAADVARERRRLAADAYLAAATGEPTEDDLKALYHQTGDSVRLVLVKVETEAAARAVLQRVAAGGDLAAEARKSLDPALAARGGDTGLLARAAVPPQLVDQVFSAPVGSMVGPVQLELSWAVARIVERSVAAPAGFAERRASIATFAREKLRARTRAHLTEQLRRKAGATVDEAFLGKLGATPSERDLDHPVATVNGAPIKYRELREAMQGVPGGHGAGAARAAFAWREVDRRIFEEEAAAKGFAKDPSVARLLPGIERNLLAGAAADTIAGHRNTSLADPKVREVVEKRRAKASIRIDKAAIEAAERELR